MTGKNELTRNPGRSIGGLAVVTGKGGEGNLPGTAGFRQNFRQDPEVVQTRQAPRWGTAN